jgi:hypothetical protein
MSENGRSIDVNGVKGTFLCSVAFHTSFHDPGILTFSKNEIDGACSYADSDISENFILQVMLNDDPSSLLRDEVEELQFDVKGHLIQKKPQGETTRMAHNAKPDSSSTQHDCRFSDRSRALACPSLIPVH